MPLHSLLKRRLIKFTKLCARCGNKKGKTILFPSSLEKYNKRVQHNLHVQPE
jgi:hypothetical protein